MIPIQPDQPMSETPDRCPYCSFQPESMNDYCDKHRPDRHAAPVPGKADEMPLYVSDALRWARTSMLLHEMPIASDSAAIWLADDRERLLARVEDLERRVADERQRANYEQDAAGEMEQSRAAAMDALDRAQRERDELATILRVAGVSYVRDGEAVV